MAVKFSINELNGLGQSEFVRVIGPVFERSPWIAEHTFAHPDLVGKLALAGKLTTESTNEQASAGLDKLSPEEISLFEKQNAAYKNKFGFPFIICARLNKKEAILRGFESRLKNSREQEIQAAVTEIFKIAELRLHDLISD